MTRLFTLLYLGVLLILFAAWYIHGVVSHERAVADRVRVLEEAHGGGARLVAEELNRASPANRPQVVHELRERFDYPVEVVPLDEIPESARSQIASGDDVAYFPGENDREFVVVPLSGGTEVVRLGPFPDYGLKSIEDALGGWMRLTAEKVAVAPPADRSAVLAELAQRFDFPVELVSREELPLWPRGRINRGEDVVLYPQSTGSEDWLAATPLPEDGSEIIRFGPFPRFEQIEEEAAATALALVLLPAAIAIALLLRPVVRQLRSIESAAKAIASGDLTVRVDERRVGSAKPLARAFNEMASRTETLIRTQRELLQAVSHELRTPLARMRFAIELVETAKDQAERRARLASIDTAAEELDELVGELLDYVRTETTEARFEPEPIAVVEILKVMIPARAGLHPAIQFDVSDEGNAPTILVADRLGFQRVIGNLLSNAGRFARNRVAIQVTSTNGGVIIDIDDDGPGIPDSERERVFEPFVRLDNSSNGHGTGLGLALVKRILTRHEGTVEVLTSPLGGCRVRTRWPNRDSATN